MMGGLDLNHSSDIQAVKLIKEILLGVVALVDAAEEGEEMEGSINDVGIKKMLLMSLIINKWKLLVLQLSSAQMERWSVSQKIRVYINLAQ